MGAILGWEGVFNTDFMPSLLHSSPSAALQSGFGNGLYGGLFFDITLGPKTLNWNSNYRPWNSFLNKFYLHVRPTVAYRTATL